jgi:enoyl-CoA hydratase/carnithine racemase
LPFGFKLEQGVAYGSRVPGLFEIKIHRPQARNAMNDALNQKVRDLYTAASEDPNIKLVVMHGGKFFTSGNDLTTLSEYVNDTEALRTYATNGLESLQQMLMAM